MHRVGIFRIPNRRIEHECFHAILRLRKSCHFHDLIEPVYALAKLLHIFVLMQKLRDFRIAGEVDVPHIVQTYDAGQRAGAFYCQPVVEHFDLDIRSLDAVITVRDGVDNQLFPCKLRVFRFGDKAGVRAEIGALLDLAAHKLQRLLNDLQDAAFKYHVLDDVHLRTDFGLRTLVPDKADTRTRKIVFRILAEQQHGGGADFFLAALGRDKFFVLAQIFLRAFPIAEFLCVLPNEVEVNILHRRVRHRGIFKIPRTLGIHELEAFVKIELLGFIPDTEENIVRLIGMKLVALQNLNQQNVVRLTVFVGAGKQFGFNLDRRLAVIKRRTQQLVDMLLIAVDAGDRTVVLHTDCNYPTVRIGKGNQMNRKRLCVDASALAVKQRRFRHSADLFDCKLAAHASASLS